MKKNDNEFVMIANLLKYTKQIADKISFYESLIDFTGESHWYNPFYKTQDVTVVWIDEIYPRDY